MVISKLKLPLVCVIFLGGFVALGVTKSSVAAGKKRAGSRREEALETARTYHNETGAREERTVRLLFLNTKWDRVLRKVADSMDKTLVADRIPAGRYNRRDTSKYTPQTALKILNRDLSRKHFRLVVKGDYLIVLEKDAERAKYRPATLNARNEHSQDPPKSTARDERTAKRPQKRTRDQIRQVGFEDTAPEKPTPKRAIKRHKPQPIAPVDIEAVAVKPSRRSAVDIARTIFRGYKPAAKLIDEGPDGLPGFIVTHQVKQYDARKKQTTASGLKLAVGIDSTKGELVVEGPQRQVDSLLNVVDYLDQTPLRRDETIQLVAGTADVKQIEESVRPILQHLRIAQADQKDNQPPQNPQDLPPGEGEPQDVQEIFGGGLKGDVRIQSIPESGLLIIIGGEEDVAKVNRMVQEIQRLGQGAVPDIQLLMLRHVRSTALAELLTALFEKLIGGRSQAAQELQPVIVLPVVTPNAIVILAPTTDMKSVLELAEKLDQPVAPDTQFRVFRLKSAVALQVVDIVNEFYGERGEVGLGPRAPQFKISADARTNSVLLFAGPRDMEEIGALISEIDREESKAVNQMRLIRLENATAEELAETLNLAIQSILNTQPTTGGGQAGQFTGSGGQGGEGVQEIRGIKSTILQFLKSEGDREEIVRSGILTDIRITPEPRTNTLMVVAPEVSMPLMEALIERLDRPSPIVAETKMFKLLNADATAVVQILDTLFRTDDEDQPIGVQLAGAENADSNLVPLRFTADPRTNIIIYQGGAEALQVAEAVMLRLDADKIRERETTVYRPKNIRSDDVALAVNQFLAERRAVEEETTELGNLFAQIEREVIVVSEPVSNSLIISATPRYFEDIHNLVLQLDFQPQEVIIQALLVEVELDNTEEFGVEVGVQDSILFDRSIITPEDITTITQSFNDPATGIVTETQSIISQASTPGFLFNNQTLGNNTIRPTTIGAQGLSNFALSRTNEELGYGGFVFSASSESVSLLIRALSESRHVEVLSRPQIRTLDNQVAEIQVGQDVPVADGVTLNPVGSANPVVRQERAGIILSVKPRITPDGRIVMEVIAEKSAFDLAPGAGVPIFSDAVSGNVIEAPVKDITTASAVVTAKSGQTIVMGGMITNNSAHVERKVPVLGDLPLLGSAFRYDLDRHLRNELLIFLTPRVIHNDETSEWIKQVEAERIHFYAEEAEAVHGPLFALPEECPTCPPGEMQAPPMVVPPSSDADDATIPLTRMPAKTDFADWEEIDGEPEPRLFQLDEEFSDGEPSVQQ